MWPTIWARVRRAVARRMGRRRDLEKVFLELLSADSNTAIEALRDGARTLPDAAIGLARVFVRQGKLTEAGSVLDDAVARFPTHAGVTGERAALLTQRWARVRQAWRRYHEGDFAGAAELFRAAYLAIGVVEPFESLTSVLCGIGWCELESFRPLEALGAFDRAARNDPDHLDAAFGRGLAVRALGRERDARTALARAAAKNRSASGPIAFIGWCHYESGRFAAAERAFRAALKLNAADGESRWGLAWTLARSDRPEAAVREFAAALTRQRHRSLADLAALAATDEHYRRLDANLARALIDRSEWAFAETIARRLYERDPIAGAPLLGRVLLAIAPERLAAPWAGETAAVSAALASHRTRAALALGNVDPAIAAARAADAEPDLLPRALEAGGQIDAALREWRKLQAAGNLDAPLEIDRLERLQRRLTAPDREPGAAARPEPPIRTRRERARALLAFRKSPDDPALAAAVRAILAPRERK